MPSSGEGGICVIKAGEAVATPNWNKIKNEYISSSISQRKLAEKHRVSFNTLKDRANKENWKSQRNNQHNKITTKTQQKTAEKIADLESDYNIDYHEFSKKAIKRANELIVKAEGNTYKSITGGVRDILEIQRQCGGDNEKQCEELKKIFGGIDDGAKFDADKIFSEQTPEDDNS